MAFVKYGVEEAPSADVRIGKLGITVTRKALEKYGLADAAFVNLYWDADTAQVGIAAADSGDRSAFSFKPRGKQGDRFVAAGKFYERFGIAITGRNATDGVLQERDGIAAFTVNVPKASLPKPPYTGKPRGRRKKEMVVPEGAAA